MNTKEIRVTKGQNIQEAWGRLVKWVDSLKVIPNNEVKVDYTKNGTIVTVMRSARSFNHPFKTYGSTKTIKVSSGMVNGLVPFINDKADGWRRIDNRDEDGNKLKVQKELPGMELDTSMNEGGKTYICLRVKADKAGTIKTPKTDLQIVQTKKAEGDKDGAGYYPLALIYLNEAKTEIESTFQIVHHNMRYLYQERKSVKGQTTGNRHLFFPV